jgi:hypothetical protein
VWAAPQRSSESFTTAGTRPCYQLPQGVHVRCHQNESDHERRGCRANEPSRRLRKVSWDQQEGRYTNYDSDLQVAIVLPGLRVRSIVHVFNSRSHTITAPIRNRVPAIRKKSSRAGALRSLGPPNQLIKIRGDTIAKTATAAKGSNTTGNSLSVVISITSLQTKRTTNSV